jgi:hypothetical protein
LKGGEVAAPFLERFTIGWLTREEKGDRLPALEKAGKLKGIAAGRVPVPFFRCRTSVIRWKGIS